MGIFPDEFSSMLPKGQLFKKFYFYSITKDIFIKAILKFMGFYLFDQEFAKCLNELFSMVPK